MNNPIFRFELKHWLKSPLFYILTAFVFLLAFVMMIGTGGYFDGPITANGKLSLLNSPFALVENSFMFAKSLLFLVAVFAGFALYRDYNSKIHGLIYAFPISKRAYLFGKFGSALLILVLSGFLTYGGIFIGEMLLGIENPKIGAFNYLSYLIVLGCYLLPTILIVCVFVFVLVGITRNIYAGFITVICFVLFQMILENTLMNHKGLLVLLDPFGQNAFRYIVQDWSVDVQNSGALPVGKMLFFNRVFWLGIAGFLGIVFYKRFDFQYDKIWTFGRKPRKKKLATTPTKIKVNNSREIGFAFSAKAQFQTFLSLAFLDLKRLMKSWLFWSLCLFGGITIFFIQYKVTNTGDFNLLPVTRLFLNGPLTVYSIIMILGTFLFAGNLVHQAKQHKMNLLIDATPVRDWQLFGSKILAITLLHLVQLLLFVLIGVGIQMINGHQPFELGLYAFHLLFLVFPVLFMWNVTSVFVHTMVPNLFLGLFLLAGMWMSPLFIEQMGISSHLLKYNALPNLDYSDFHQYGMQLKGQFLLMSFWLSLGLVLLGGIRLLWNRGIEENMKSRWFTLRARFSKPLAMVMTIGFLGFFGLGFQIYQAEQVRKMSANGIRDMRSALKDYKKDWEAFKYLPIPKIVEVDLKIDLFPKEERFEAQGAYVIVNKNDFPLDTLLVRTGFDEITTLKWDRKATLVMKNEGMKSQLFVLNKALAPRDSIRLTFQIQSKENTILSRNSNVISQGTFMKNDILPRIGYQFLDQELPIETPNIRQRNYFQEEADFLTMRTIISTDSDQIAIAPGELVREKQEGNRRIFEYKTLAPIKLNFSFHSADFAVKKEDYLGKNLRIYYQKGHAYNADLMMEGLKASLKFNTDRFTDYPNQQIRIIEFPHTEEPYSATLTANNIPTSEVLFCIHSKAMEEKVILPFYVMAHELTHEWFGNQVMPADAEGSRMLTESITEYISLRIYEEYFGEEVAEEFLRKQWGRYHKGKKKERKEERPLYKVLADQHYISYGKGAMALHVISEAIGKEQMEAVLKEYILTFKDKDGHYPTTLDFIEILKGNTERKHHPLIEDWLMKVKDLKEGDVF